MAQLVLWGALAAAWSSVTVGVLHSRGDVSLAGPSVVAQLLTVAAGAALIFAGGLTRRGSAVWYLVAAGATWSAAEWASPAAPDAVVLTAGLLLGPVTLPCLLAAHARGRPPVWVATIAAAGGAALSGLGGSMAASPGAAGCTDCHRDLIAVTADVSLAGLLTRVGIGLQAVVVVALLLGFVVRRAGAAGRSAAPAREAPWLAAVAVLAAYDLVTVTGDVSSAAAYDLRAAAAVALVTVAIGVAVPAVRARLAVWAVARAALGLSAAESLEAADVLRRALRDERLEVHYPGPEGGWIDAEGHLVADPGPGTTTITDRGQPLAALVHGRGARVDQTVVLGAVATARVFLDTGRLQAWTAARVIDLTQARRLAVEAADQARNRLERDLHDGAQQRLVALRFALGLTAIHADRAHAIELTAAIAVADGAAEEALAELRDLAHGVSSAALTIQGLGHAISAAAERTRVLVTITELPTDELPVGIARPVYRLIADVVGEADRVGTPRLLVGVRRADGKITVEVQESGGRSPTVVPEAMKDRVQATGGAAQVAGPADARRLIVAWPCES